MSVRQLSADEKRWQAESDANTLAEAKVIEGDAERLERAKEEARRIAAEQETRAKAMKAI